MIAGALLGRRWVALAIVAMAFGARAVADTEPARSTVARDAAAGIAPFEGIGSAYSTLQTDHFIVAHASDQSEAARYRAQILESLGENSASSVSKRCSTREPIWSLSTSAY